MKHCSFIQKLKAIYIYVFLTSDLCGCVSLRFEVSMNGWHVKQVTLISESIIHILSLTKVSPNHDQAQIANIVGYISR